MCSCLKQNVYTHVLKNTVNSFMICNYGWRQTKFVLFSHHREPSPHYGYLYGTRFSISKREFTAIFLLRSIPLMVPSFPVMRSLRPPTAATSCTASTSLTTALYACIIIPFSKWMDYILHSAWIHTLAHPTHCLDMTAGLHRSQVHPDQSHLEYIHDCSCQDVDLLHAWARSIASMHTLPPSQCRLTTAMFSFILAQQCFPLY